MIRIGAMKESQRSKPDWQQVRSEVIDQMDLTLQLPVVQLPHHFEIEQAFRAFFTHEIIQDNVQHNNNAFEEKLKNNPIPKL